MATAAVLALCALTATALGTATSRKQYCGDSLTSKLYTLCGGMYNKRWEPHEAGMYAFRAAREELLSHISPLGVFTRRSTRDDVGRRRRGIVQECCHRGCTIRELSAYCRDRRR